MLACRRCEQSLRECDRFCSNCGRPTALASRQEMIEAARAQWHRLRKTPHDMPSDLRSMFDPPLRVQ